MQRFRAFVRRRAGVPSRANPTLVLAVCAALSTLIYAAAFTRLAYIPKVWNTPILTGVQISLRTIDGGRWDARLSMIFGFVALGILYFFGYRAARDAKGWLPTAIVTFGAVAAGLALLGMYPFGAADIFDNITHGRMVAFYGANPFQQVAADFPRDPFLTYTAWKTSRSAYGPLWELYAAAQAWVAGNGIATSMVVFKLGVVVFWALTLVVAWKMLRRAGRGPALPAFLLLAWNPLLLYEVWGNAHNDMMMAFFVLLAAWMVMQKRFALAVLALVAGGLVKYIPFLLLPVVGLIALQSLPDLRRRAVFVVVSAIASLALAVAAFAPFWVGLDTLTIDRRAKMLSGTPASAIHSILVDGPGKLPKDDTAQEISKVLAAATIAVALLEGWRARKRPDWEGFVHHSFNILMLYLLVTVPWFQQWYAIWPLILLPFLDSPARSLALVFGFSVLGKQLWVDPSLYWSRRWAPLPAREIGFALGNLSIAWLMAAYVVRPSLKRALAAIRASLPLLRLPLNRRPAFIAITGKPKDAPPCDD